MNLIFPTVYEAIIKKIDHIDPIQYGNSRNYIHGAVTYLSPYLSRGVISTKQVLSSVLNKGYQIQQIDSFVKELCWRDYFQRVGQYKDLSLDIRPSVDPTPKEGIPAQVLTANTGITGIDNAIHDLYLTGYMHNHCRMYTASLVCNIAKTNWKNPSLWMYYHLLDGDWASNACSWQWVAGTNSSKKYYANQENINKFTSTNQVGTYLDTSYEAFVQMEIPESLLATQNFEPAIHLPEHSFIEGDPVLPTFIYNYYNLDPMWHKGEKGNRILLIEPELFKQYPVNKKCIDFMIALSKNMEGIQVYVGSFKSLVENQTVKNIYYKEHPLNTGYVGTEEPRDWIANNVTKYYPSFFGYWKDVQKQLSNQSGYANQ